jgi:hypothetical protein
VLVIELAGLQLLVAVTARGFVALFWMVGGAHVGALGAAPTTMLSVPGADMIVLASAAVTVKLKVPAVLGVPVIAPVALRLKPGARLLPVPIDHV